MFQKDDIVVYGNVGVCRVTDISELDFMADKKMYYTLSPLYEENRIIYTPVDGHKHKMRPIITKGEAERFIEKLPSIKADQYTNEKERKEAYHEIILSGNLERWASMIHFIYQKEQERASKGQKTSTHYMEEMKSVEKLLLGELAAALRIPFHQMKTYLNRKLHYVSN